MQMSARDCHWGIYGTAYCCACCCLRLLEQFAMNYSNYEGHVFGKLLVRLDLGVLNTEHKSYRTRMVLAECLGCFSGVKSYLLSSLKSSNTRSCGCLKKEILLKNITQHGQSKTAAYTSWLNMKQRCSNPNNPNYKYYGGRGIFVCDRWLNSFENFLADMGDRPNNCDIDRRNNNEGYSPENCRWVSKTENNFNQRKRKDNKSGKTGVIWNKFHNKWEAHIRKNKKYYCLGKFKNLNDAIKARKKAELKLFGYTKE